MKKDIQTLVLFILILSASSCKDKIEDTYIINEPQYMSFADLRSSFNVKGGQEIIQPGKLYFKDNFIFVNEYQKGIHIVNNSDPSNPLVVKFIEIPGNVDLAIAGNTLYADSYIDLLAIDISNINDIKEVARIDSTFQYIVPYITEGIQGEVNVNNGVVIGWKQVEKTEKVENIMQYNNFPVWEKDMLVSNQVASNITATANGNFGTGGSMARFTLYDNYLYTVNNYTLKLFNISTPTAPSQENEINIGWNIETIFPYEGKLFIGSRTGMYIYSLSNPSNPKYISQFRHSSSCDPVVVEGDYAYVTLRAGNLCGDSESQLDVIDISDIQKPTFLKSYPMVEPYGLGIDDSVLFVCDGNAGLKIYNASDPLKISQNKLAEYSNINTFDVIPLGNVLLLIGADGLYQYDYSDLENITQLSFIPIYGTTNK
jgi:hypothetical protein